MGKYEVERFKAAVASKRQEVATVKTQSSAAAKASSAVQAITTLVSGPVSGLMERLNSDSAEGDSMPLSQSVRLATGLVTTVAGATMRTFDVTGGSAVAGFGTGMLACTSHEFVAQSIRAQRAAAKQAA